MSHKLGLRTATVVAALSLGLVGQAVLAGTAGALTATKAELKNGQLRVEGRGAAPGGSVVIASSTTSVASARIDVNGGFKIQASNFTAPDCKITVSDQQTPTATVSLAGCTPSITPVPASPAPPTGSCVITPQAPVTVPAGVATSVFFQTTGCNTTFNSGATPTPVQWKVVAGSIPTGMTGPNSQGTTAGNIIGTPSIVGTYRFTLQVTDQIGATDQETFTVNVT
jgi:putative Ig domain-containing protein